MKQYARTVDAPTISEEEKAYNPERPISSLLIHQLRQLHAAEQHLDEKDRTGINISTLHTELAASKYIRKVMKKLLERPGKKSAAKAAKRKAVARKKPTAALKKKTTKKPDTPKKRK